MKLYYTGAKKFSQPQLDPSLSLGGLISSSEIPNGLLSNLFGPLSRYTVQNNKSEIRAFVIYNDDVAALTGLKAYFTYPQSDTSPATDTNDCEFDIGFATVSSNNCGDLSIEKVSNIYATPYTVTLSSGAEGLANALDLPDIASGTYLGIFLRRKLLASAIAVKSDADLLAIMNETLILPTEEDIQLTFVWT